MSTPDGPWAGHLPVSQVRIAQPTDRLDEVVAFYRDGLEPSQLTTSRVGAAPLLTPPRSHLGDGVEVDVVGGI
jgi:hypothetical protein